MKWLSVLILSSVSGLSTAEVLDLGQLDQYKGKTSNIPKLSGNVIWVSGHGDEGYDVALSADTQSQVHGVLGGCGGTDDRCFHDVLGVLQAACLQVDAQTEPRAFLGQLDSTCKTRAGFLAFYASVLQSLWAVAQQQQQQQQQQQDAEALRPGHFLPYAQASEAALLATVADPVTVQAAGVTAWTMTPSPAPTKVTLQGRTPPKVTEYSTPTQPSAEGDSPEPAVTQYIARLDADLAQRIDSAMRTARGDCRDGRRLDTTDLSSRRRRQNSYGAAICGAEALAPMIGVGGPFHDLLLLGPDDHRDETTEPLTFSAPAAERAAAAVRGFFSDAAAAPLGLDAGLARRLGTFIFALAVDALVEGHVLVAENQIDAAVVPFAAEI